MFFPMKLNKVWAFWMFGMFYPIKIIFIDENKKIINIENAVPYSFSPKTWNLYKPDKPCKYILEVVSESNFSVGDEISYSVF